MNVLEFLDTTATSDVVDVSSVVEDVINLIVNLPDDVTIADVLIKLSDPLSGTLSFLPEDQLISILTDVGELIDDIAPSQLLITPILEQGTEFVTELLDGSGIITIDGSNISGALTVGGTTREFTTDLSEEINKFLDDASSFLSGITGNASLSSGQFTGDGTIDGTLYELGIDLTGALTDSLTNLLISAESTLPFVNGVVALDFETVFGDIEGTIDFVGGDLDLDLTTPFGALETSVAFPDDSQIDVPVDFLGISAVELDLFDGQLSVPILGGIDIPLDALSGAIALSEGIATLTLDNILPTSIETTFEVGPLASQVAVALTENLSGAITIDGGDVNGPIASDFGQFEVIASFDDLLIQASSLIDATTGTLTLDDGLASINLDTPLGPLSGGLALVELDTSLAGSSSLLT
ncbi:MAG: hypothetical protein AAGA83_04290 [Cyanobacteria bacterium P01_F01_bin.116]